MGKNTLWTTLFWYKQVVSAIEAKIDSCKLDVESTDSTQLADQIWFPKAIMEYEAAGKTAIGTNFFLLTIVEHDNSQKNSTITLK